MSSGDILVYDMASQSEGTPEVFVQKSWLSILDNQSTNYSSNQSVIDTSQLSNSNRYMNYREAYLVIPLLMTLTCVPTDSQTPFAPQTAGTSADYCMGLRNWIGTIIHSFTLDMNGTTIIAQTPLLPMYNTFKLMTTLSVTDIMTQGATMGFYPDDGLSFTFTGNNASQCGTGTGNNNNQQEFIHSSGGNDAANPNNGNSYVDYNEGLLKRQMYYNFNPSAVTGNPKTTENTVSYAALLPDSSIRQSYKSYIFNYGNNYLQLAITGIVYLKHIHSFFNEVPLLKGTFFKMTMFLSNESVSFPVTAGSATFQKKLGTPTITNPLGGVAPIMIASTVGGSKNLVAGVYTASLSVGSKCLNTAQTSIAGVTQSPLANAISLNVPAYTFSPVWEQAYLSNPVKRIIYEDLYQYQYLNAVANNTFNFLVTNGIANLKKVLVLPFYTASANGGVNPYESPYEGSGSGTTSPLCLLGNFNVVVSGANQIYNSERYTYEQFCNQLYGINSINGGQSDGLQSGLINQLQFEMMYNYYVVNVGRMLPVEQAVPKSVSIIGTNLSGLNVNLYVFLSYGVQVDVDVLTGSRV